MPREGKASITADEEQVEFLRNLKGSEKWGTFLTDLVHGATDHTPEIEERQSPTGAYIICKECGRSENSLRELSRRPCKQTIPVDKQRETGESEF